MQQLSVVDPNLFVHVRMLIGIIVALSLGRLLNGLAAFVQHPSRRQVNAIHILWVVFTFLFIIQFWWWEFNLSTVKWDFLKFCFIIIYASTLYFLCTLLFPDNLYEYNGYGDYFMSRRGWFFSIFISFMVLDYFDSMLKGAGHLSALGAEYHARGMMFIILSLVAMWVKTRMFHIPFALVAIVYEFIWALRKYSALL